LGCGAPRLPDPLGRMEPYVGGGLHLYECPISFAFHDPLSAGLLSAYQDRQDGIIPPWGEGSALYHEAMGIIHAYVKEYERLKIEKLEKDLEKK